MLRIATIFACLVLLGVLIRVEHKRAAVRSEVQEGCVACHAGGSGPNRFHPVAAFGCASCHLGNKYAFEARRAHQGMVLNPGDLRYAARTCGREGCHPEHVERVKNSVMATNTGIIASLYRLWGMDAEGLPGDIPALTASTREKSPPMDYFAKLCASCHLWRPIGTGHGEFAERGGGCSACHVVRRHKISDTTYGKFTHAEMSMRVPLENCVRCHNRSGRIGLTYQGKLEDDGYGTPFEDSGPSRRRLSGSRYYLEIVPDVHFRAGMVCIDCHTGTELMGDGKYHAELESQLEIRCEDCHAPKFASKAAAPERFAEAVRMAGFNKGVPPPGTGIASAGKGSPLYALRPMDTPGKAVLHRKMDGTPLPFSYDLAPRPHHRLPGHEHLSCQACHSPVMPQCCGCHVAAYGNATQADKLLGRTTPGKWIESRSFTRFEAPALAAGKDGRILPASPCRAAISIFGRNGTYCPEVSFNAGTARTFDPHSTQKKSRTCPDCHLRPKSMGMGTGRRDAGGHVEFQPVYDAARSGFITPGSPGSLDDLSAGGFNATRIARIRRVGPCLPCHHDYADPVYGNFTRSMERLHAGKAGVCDLHSSGPVQRDTL